MRRYALAALLITSACDSESSAPDGGATDAGGDGAATPTDGGAVDDGAIDAGDPDAGALDAAPADAGALDAGLDGGSDASTDGGALEGGAPDASAADDAGDATSDAAIADGGACGTTVETFAIAASPHVTTCSAVTYATSPPTSGPHYPVWAGWRTYTERVPAGFLVHSMEHGAVVVTYNCPAGCPEDLAALQALLDARPADPLCVEPLRNRFIVAPDPTLDVRFAAAAWGAALRSSCFDLAALRTFLDDHYAQAPEDFCNDGIDGFPTPCGS